jgi:hypothetical protein
VLGHGDELVGNRSELSHLIGLREGDRALCGVGECSWEASDGIGHAVAVLLVEDAAEDRDPQGTAQLASGVVHRGGDALLAWRE